jgi:disulfide bond formation protein DsbB
MITIETIQSVNSILGIFGVLGILSTIFLVVDMRGQRMLAPYISSWGLHAALFVAVVASILSLVYSEVFGLIPCGLCWFERMMLFPQVLIIGAALYFKDTFAPVHGIVLSGIGLIISLYHHYLQMGGSAFVKCPAAGVGSDCAKRFFFEFGFITFPLMSAILFAFLIALYLYIRKERTK